MNYQFDQTSFSNEGNILPKWAKHMLQHEHGWVFMK